MRVPVTTTKMAKTAAKAKAKMTMMKSHLRIIAVLACLGAGLCLMAGCRSAEEPDLYPHRGTVVFNSFEGGFYGILGEGGRRLDPINLPAEFRRDGLRIRFEYEPRPDLASIHMWGEMIEIVRIKRAAGFDD